MHNDQLARIISSIGFLKDIYIYRILPCWYGSRKSSCRFVFDMEHRKQWKTRFTMGSGSQEQWNCVFWTLTWEWSYVLSQHSFKTFRCSQDSETCRITKRTFVWPLLYLIRIAVIPKILPIQYNVDDNFILRFFLRRHSRMYIHVTMENSWRFFSKFCLVKNFFSESSSF